MSTLNGDNKMNFFKAIIAILIFGAAFLLGTLYMKPTQLSLVDQVKKNVNDVLAYPQAAQFKNIEYHFSRYTEDNGKVGYVCGEVFRYKNDKPDGYKRFIVKAYTRDDDSRMDISIPFVEGGHEILLPEQVNRIWNEKCSSPASPLV
ncbi:hypothetical protein [Providencia sp. PROV259]|uniref:hypothetical protein n=1 Tax=Providencia sp. PROV259 TaxID=2949947 RepID=UPI00234A3630|nr:hypothetical protein [Providencia sp. PROV259]